MVLDVELYRRTIYVPSSHGVEGDKPRRISVIDICPQEATYTLVFVHGYGGDALQWLHQLRFFGQTARVIAPDLRGHGASDDPDHVPYSMNSLVDDLDVVLEALEVGQPYYLIAHSFGGAIATEFALRHAGEHERDHQAGRGNSGTGPGESEGLVLIGVPERFILQAWIRRGLRIPDPIFSRFAKLIHVALYAPQRTLQRMHDHIMSIWRGSERFQQLRLPTLVILGQRDNVFLRQHYEEVPRSIPNAQQVVISVSAHLVQLERPDAVNRAINRFITSVETRHTESANAPTAVGAQFIAPAPTDVGAQFIAPAAPAQEIVAERQKSRIHRRDDRPWLQYYDGDVPHRLPPSRQLLHEMLSNAAHAFPNRPAIIFFNQNISYRELDLLSNRFAHALRNLGVSQGDRIAIVLPNVPQAHIAFYGTLKAGAVVALSSPLSNEAEIAYQLQNAEAKVLLILTAHRAMVERIAGSTSIEHIIYTDVREYLPVSQRVLIASLIENGDALPSSPVALSNGTGKQRRPRQHAFQQLLHRQRATLLDSSTTDQDLALLQYTSGTTDMPKGVMLSHSNLVANVIQVRHWMPEARRGHETILGVLPLSHSYGVTSCMNMAVAIAASLVLLPTQRIDQILETIKRHHPSIFPGVPALYLAIANYPKVRSYGVSAIRVCISGSAPLPVEVQEAFEKLTRGHLVEGYGLTEASPVTHSNPLKGERRVGCIGLPLPATDARIVDLQGGAPLPPGEVGELLISGPQVMQGYWRMPEETAKVLEGGWLHTGDLARMDEDGFFTIVDRKKDLILSGPLNIYPRDVEEVLYEHPKVLEAVVVSSAGQEGSSSSPFIKAFIVLKRGERATPEELLALCRERLDSYKVPKQIEFRSELPKNSVGKILRRLLVDA